MILARLLSASPSTDGEAWDLQFRWHTDDWHTDAYAQNPAPFQRNTQSGIPSRAPYPWKPAWLPFPGFDSLSPGQMTFEIVIDEATSPVQLEIIGVPPVNAAPTMQAPQCPLIASVSTSGGTIPSGTYLLAISAAANGPTSPYVITAVIPAGTTTGSITIPNVVWPGRAPAISLYAGSNALKMVQIPAWTGSVTDAFGNPTTFTITSVVPSFLQGAAVGLPDRAFNSFLLRAKDIIHGGVWGDSVTSVSTSGGLATATFAAGSWTTNQWAGYVISSYTRPLNLTVASNTANTLTFTTGNNFVAGEVVVMRAKSGSITSNTIGDANFINSYAPSGLTANAEAGNLIRIIAGTGAGQPPAVIASNTTTVFTIAGAWVVTPGATSVFIVEAPAWRYSLTTGASSTNGTNSSLTVGSIPITNFSYGTLLVQALTLDANGNPSVVHYAPFRELWVPPNAIANTQSTIAYTPYNVSPNDEVLTFGNGSSVVNLCPLASISRHTLTLINAPSNTSNITVNADTAAGDTIQGGSSVTITPGNAFQLMPNA